MIEDRKLLLIMSGATLSFAIVCGECVHGLGESQFCTIHGYNEP